jgi:hypothetical protein
MEKITVKDNRMYGLLALYDMHTEFFKRAIVDITPAAAQSRLDTKANHVAWLAGSLVHERHELATLLGEPMQMTAYELFRDHKGIQEDATYPPLADFQTDWERVSPVLRELLANVSAEKLDSNFEMEGMSMPYYDFISFMTYREANCIGQIALWRRLLGYPALKYEP